MGEQGPPSELHRHFGVWQATALNVAMVVGAGVFITIPPMLKVAPGPYALLGWLLAGALILVDGLFWSELGAALPGAGGSYHYLLESYGRSTWGRLAAFLFIWQFLLSGPLELASGLIAMDTFSQELSRGWKELNAHPWLHIDLWRSQKLSLTLSPARVAGLGVGALIIALLYNRVTILGRLSLVFCLAVLALIAWIIIVGAVNFRWSVAFDWPDLKEPIDAGAAMRLALYSYLGYYNICYLGDEVKNPGRTIPRAVLMSAALVIVLFVLVHLALLGTVSWHDVPTEDENLEGYSLPAEFMKKVYGKESPAVAVVTVCLLGSCFIAAFAGLLGYSRIPYGAARAGHFFGAVAAVHPRRQMPHVSLLLVGGMMLFWSLFELQAVIDALIVTRILEQFVAQTICVGLLRRRRPDLPRPFRVWLYPLTSALALTAWLYVYFTAEGLYIALGLATLAAGVVVFLVWAQRRSAWPFDLARPTETPGD
jgi:amino acid transporter